MHLNAKVTDKFAKKKCVFVRRLIFEFELSSQDGVVNPDRNSVIMLTASLVGRNTRDQRV